MNVWSVSASISVTIRDIWTKFGTELMHYTLKTPECSKFTQLENPRWRRPPSWISGKCQQLHIGLRYLHQIWWDDASRPCGDDHVTQSRNRKLIRVTSSNERLAHRCVDLTDYNIYLNPIRYRAQAPHHQADGTCQIHLFWKSKMTAAAILDFGKMSITSNWIEPYAPNLVGRCVTAVRRCPRDQQSKPEVNSRDVIKWTSGA